MDTERNAQEPQRSPSFCTLRTSASSFARSAQHRNRVCESMILGAGMLHVCIVQRNTKKYKVYIAGNHMARKSSVYLQVGYILQGHQSRSFGVW